MKCSLITTVQQETCADLLQYPVPYYCFAESSIEEQL
jgi:hypothetical protein